MFASSPRRVSGEPALSPDPELFSVARPVPASAAVAGAICTETYTSTRGRTSDTHSVDVPGSAVDPRAESSARPMLIPLHY